MRGLFLTVVTMKISSVLRCDTVIWLAASGVPKDYATFRKAFWVTV